MGFDLDFRPADSSDASTLSELAMRSKAHWGYSRTFLEACRDELSVTNADLESADVDCIVAVRGQRQIGFCTLRRASMGEFELDALFVEPADIGRGVGRALLDQAMTKVRDAGGRTLTIQGDPHAAGFYLAVGAKEIGARESGSIPGRLLPLYKLDVA